MRPFEKGSWPTRKNSIKTKLKFNDWKRAIHHLQARTGEFCHLCEMAVNHQIAVEHIKPRKSFPRLTNSWTNFLLSCSHCNSRKSSSSPLAPYRTRYIWPHIHNTLLAFEIPLRGSDLGLIQPRSSLSTDITLQQRARETINLYGLDKFKTSDGASDRRYIHRLEAIQMASERRIEYERGQATIRAIVDMAKKTGFFTVWFTIFSDVPSIKIALINEPCFGLDSTWFDHNHNPIPRTHHDKL